MQTGVRWCMAGTTNWMEMSLKKNLLQVALGLVVSLTMGSAAADDTLGWVATAAVTHGGDDWQVARSAAGTPLNMHGGGRFALGAGMAWKSAAYPVMGTLVANYHFDTRAGVNGDAKFTRAPIDGMVYFTGLEKLRFGVGLSYIVSPSVKASIDGQSHTITLKNAIGKSVEIGYELSPNLWANVRLSSAKFEPKAAGGAMDADVSHVAANVSIIF
jgi:hypothetical protein